MRAVLKAVIEGRVEGRVEGERRVLERQLQRRFGALSAENTERLTEASMEDLETWAENVLDAQTLDDVFEPGPLRGQCTYISQTPVRGHSQ